MAGSAVGAGIASAALTGWEPVDVLSRGALGAAVAAAGARAPHWFLAGVAVIGTLAGAASAPGVMSVAALGGAIALLVARRRLAVVNSVGAALLVQAALRLDWPDFTGGPSLVATSMVVPLLLVGVTHLNNNHRRLVAWGAGLIVVLWVVGAATGGLVGLRARADVDDAIRASRRGLEAIEEADRRQAIAELDQAAGQFERAHRMVGSWWARAAFVVPLVGHQMEAVHTLTAVGGDLAETAAREVERVDIGALRLAGGTVDLKAILDARGPLDRSSASLRDAMAAIRRVRSPWLVAPIAERVERLHGEVREAATDAERTRDAVRVVPALLGADGPRRYFLAIQTPAESRATGGLIGNFGEISADNGQLRLSRFGRSVDLNRGGNPAARRLKGPDDYVTRYARFRPQHTWQNVNMSPHLPSVAEVVAGLYPQSGGRPIDGLITVDPTGLAAVLELIGPVEVDGWPEPLTTKNVERILLHEQYLAFEREERIDFLGDAAEAIWARLVSTTLPGPRELGRLLGPAVRGRHLQVVSLHDPEVPFLREAGLLGELSPARPDSLAVITQNSGGNKIDWFLHRSITYDLEIDPESGVVEGSATIELRNDAPSTGLPTSVIGAASERPTQLLGDNRTILSVYTPLHLGGTPTLDGEPLGMNTETEIGRNVYTAGLVVPAGSARTIRLPLVGQIAEDYDLYRLTVHRQPLVHPDRLRVELGSPEAGAMVEERALTEDVTIAFEADDRTAQGFWRRFVPD